MKDFKSFNRISSSLLFALPFLTVPPQNTFIDSQRSTPHSVPKKQRKKKIKACTAVVRSPNKNLIQGNAAERTPFRFYIKAKTKLFGL